MGDPARPGGHEVADRDSVQLFGVDGDASLHGSVRDESLKLLGDSREALVAIGNGSSAIGRRMGVTLPSISNQGGNLEDFTTSRLRDEIDLFQLPGATEVDGDAAHGQPFLFGVEGCSGPAAQAPDEPYDREFANILNVEDCCSLGAIEGISGEAVGLVHAVGDASGSVMLMNAEEVQAESHIFPEIGQRRMMPAVLQLGDLFEKSPEEARISPLDPGSVEWELLQQEIEMLLKKLFFRSVQLPPPNLDQKLLKTNDMMAHNTDNSWVYSPNPLSALFCRRWFQALMFLVGIMWVCFGANASYVALSDGLIQYRHFRFTVLEVRGGGDASSAQISDLGMLVDGCKAVNTAEKEVKFYGQISLVDYEESVQVNGWYFVTHAGDPAFDPVRFRLEGSSDGETWQQIGSSHLKHTQMGQLVMIDEYADVTTDRSATVNFSREPLWTWQLDTAVCALISAAGILVAAGCGLMLETRLGKLCLFIAVIISCVAHLAGGIGVYIGKNTQGEVETGFLHFTRAAAEFITACLLHFDEPWVVEAVILDGLLLTLTELLALALACRTVPSLGPVIFFGIGMIVLGTSLQVYRRHVFRHVRQRITNDAMLYDNVWKNLTADYSEDKVLSEIALRCRAKVAELPSSGALHQCERAQQESNVRRQSVFTRSRQSPSTPSATPLNGPHIDSLDVLMAGAHALHPLLKYKVKEWAEISGGKFPLRTWQSVGFVRWDHAMKPENCAIKENIRWPTVKQPQRALEKILTAYRGDVSKLTDLCRQCIVFEHFEDILMCLQAIFHDEEVLVERVVNRLDTSYNATESGGYRDVKVNLRIVSEDAERLRLETHICEVLLVPKKVMELQNPDRHQRYIGFRNSRYRSGLDVTKQILNLLHFSTKRDTKPVEIAPPPSEEFLFARSSTAMSRRQISTRTGGKGFLGDDREGQVDKRKARLEKINRKQELGGDGADTGSISKKPDSGGCDFTAPERGFGIRQRRVSYGEDVLMALNDGGGSDHSPYTSRGGSVGESDANFDRALSGTRKMSVGSRDVQSENGSRRPFVRLGHCDEDMSGNSTRNGVGHLSWVTAVADSDRFLNGIPKRSQARRASLGGSKSLLGERDRIGIGRDGRNRGRRVSIGGCTDIERERGYTKAIVPNDQHGVRKMLMGWGSHLVRQKEQRSESEARQACLDSGAPVMSSSPGRESCGLNGQRKWAPISRRSFKDVDNGSDVQHILTAETWLPPSEGTREFGIREHSESEHDVQHKLPAGMWLPPSEGSRECSDNGHDTQRKVTAGTCLPTSEEVDIRASCTDEQGKAFLRRESSFGSGKESGYSGKEIGFGSGKESGLGSVKGRVRRVNKTYDSGQGDRM